MVGLLIAFHWLVDLAVKRKTCPSPEELTSVSHTAQPPMLLQPSPTVGQATTLLIFPCPLKKMKVPKSFLHPSMCVCMHAHVCIGESHGLG